MFEVLTQVPAARRASKERNVTSAAPPAIPDYLREIYHWAYLNPRSLAIFDHDVVVSAILWGNHGRLRDAAVAEIEPGQRVLEMERGFNHGAGFTDADDQLPEFMLLEKLPPHDEVFTLPVEEMEKVFDFIQKPA